MPALRLAWPTETRPAAGAASEVVLTLREDVDGESLLAYDGPRGDPTSCSNSRRSSRSPWATSSSAAANGHSIPGRPRSRSATTAGGSTSPGAHAGSSRSATASSHPRRRTSCARRPGRTRNCRYPRSSSRTSPCNPTAGASCPAPSIAELASGYAEFVAAVPRRGSDCRWFPSAFARSEVDSALREPSRHRTPGAALAADGRFGTNKAAPVRASVVPGLTDELAELLTESSPALSPPDLSGPRLGARAGRLDAHRLGLARLTELLSGIERTPPGGSRLYAALEPLAVDALAVGGTGVDPGAAVRRPHGHRTTQTVRVGTPSAVALT